jgi:hypothetical protein
MLGVFVTQLNSQTYEELRLENMHPVVVLAGKVRIGKVWQRGFANGVQVQTLLEEQYSMSNPERTEQLT